MTVGNSRPFAECRVIIITFGSVFPCSLSTSDSSDKRSTNPPSDGSASRDWYSWRRKRAPSGSRCGPRTPRSCLHGDRGGSQIDRAPCRAGSETGSRRATSARAMIRSRNAASDATCLDVRRRPSTAVTSLVHSEFCATVGANPASSGGRFVSTCGHIDGFERVHHAFADAARRNVDDPPKRDVIVRIQNQLEVRQRVLDFPALIEADAAQNDVGNSRGAQRILDGARLRVGAIQDGGQRRVIALERLANRCG